MIEAVQSFAAKQALKYMEQEPEKNLPKLLDWADKFDKNDLYLAQRKVLRKVLDHPEGNWYQLIRKVLQLDEGVRNAFLENFMVNASLIGGARQAAIRRQEGSMFPGPFCWTPLPLATSAAPAAGQRSTDIT